MLLSEKIVFTAVGQCGGNIVSELENLNFNAFYINSSLEDLDLIDTDRKNKYHIKGARGMAKDRLQAKERILEGTTAEDICDSINDQYSMASVINFVYALGGGSGGGMTGYIIEQMKELYPEKIINAIVVIPKATEDIGVQYNAIESLKHLKRLLEEGIVNQIHILDNNSRDNIMTINKDFAVCMDRFINYDEINKEGNLDEEERERILIERGIAVVLEFYEEDFANGLANASDKTIYAPWLKNPKLQGLIFNQKQNLDVNKQVVQDVLGIPIYTHDSICEDESNVLYSVGMSFNDNILVNMNNTAKSLLEKKNKLEEEVNTQKVDNLDFDTSAFTKILSESKPVNQPTKDNPDKTIKRRRRRRSEKNASSMLDKYRNM